MVAGEDDALGLAGLTVTQLEWAVGAEVIEINSGVADRHHGSEVAEWLTDEDGEGGMRLCSKSEGEGSDEKCGERGPEPEDRSKKHLRFETQCCVKRSPECKGDNGYVRWETL